MVYQFRTTLITRQHSIKESAHSPLKKLSQRILLNLVAELLNAAGTAETNATLSVKEAEPEEQLSPPVFTKRLESSAAQEGSTFQMECKVEGNPLPTVQWYKNDVCIDTSPDYVITYNNGEAVLRFEEVFPSRIKQNIYVKQLTKSALT
ncbi:hypothetical protein L9F63_027067 [Diploptera punctata]|uniref:Ig-like domain-containing protein n=1 Tax=Diploptera punctata TaxID=6984 RepID=A0AAD8ENT6_DIPPU|nr:hypothetical protein L9F63_027067 [Diploptera punctata]